MQFHYDRTVLAYHGCDVRTAQRLLAGEPFMPSTNAYDWLGHGIYFWEFGVDRAWGFARELEQRGRIETPAVVGVVLQLGHCFDLLDTHFTRDLHTFFPVWREALLASGATLPSNRGPSPERKGRYLDCAVLNAYLSLAAEQGDEYDSVRGVFLEGGEVYPGAGFQMASHIQIAVRNPRSILGVFQPVAYSLPSEGEP